jgi:lysozyme
MDEAKKLAIEILKMIEKFSAAWYLDSAGKRTIGYGETCYGGDSITEEEASKLLEYRVDGFLAHVRKEVKTRLLPCQEAALTSFSYQQGKRAFSDSTLLKEINLGRLAYAIRELRRWVYVHKNDVAVVEPGIVRRREHEIKMFLGDETWRMGW